MKAIAPVGAGALPRPPHQVPPQPPSLLPYDPPLLELVSLAARLMGARHAVLLLAEPRGDWLVASHGLEVQGPRLLEDGRLAESTARNSGVLQLELPGSPSLSAHPLRGYAPRLRAYAGAPVVSEDGAWRGALAVLDTVRLELRPDELDALATLARQVAARLQLLRQVRGLEDAETALRESEDRFRLFAQNALDVLYRVFLEPTPRFDFVSASVAEVLGYPPEAFYADPGLALRALHPEERERLGQVRRDLELQDMLALTLRWIRADGSVAYTEHRQRVERDASGRVVAVQGIARDITERRRAEEQQWKTHALLQAVVESSGDAIFVKDLDGSYALINPVGAALLGYEVSEVVGKRDADLFSPESAREISERDREILAEGKARTYEMESTAAGVAHTWLSTKTPLRMRDGEVAGLVGISRDITSLKARDTERERKLDEIISLLAARDAWRASISERLVAVERTVRASAGHDEALSDAARTLRELAEELHAGKPQLDDTRTELRIQLPDLTR